MKKKKINITVTTKTGLHIGSGNDKLQIGGIDSAVIKDPVTKLPYIPGSSIKGKIRCLLETESDNYGDGELNEKLNRIFGLNNAFRSSKGKNADDYDSPTRLIFRDLFLSQSDRENFETGKYSTEYKTEIVIDRKKGSAKDGGLRTIERVPPEIDFTGEIIIRYLDENELSEIEKTLMEGFELLNSDYLGGSGSRGYGAITIKLN